MCAGAMKLAVMDGPLYPHSSGLVLVSRPTKVHVLLLDQVRSPRLSCTQRSAVVAQARVVLLQVVPGQDHRTRVDRRRQGYMLGSSPREHQSLILLMSTVLAVAWHSLLQG